MFDKPRTKALQRLIETDKRIVGLSIEADGVFIYTNSWEWCDSHGAGGFRGDSETAAIKRYKERVMKRDPELHGSN